MKIVVDLDGTLTNFNEFVKNTAIPFFEKKGMVVVKPNELEVEDIFDMENFFINKYNCSKEKAKKLAKEALDEFWVGFNFVKFSLLNKFRPEVRDFINKKIKEGHSVEIHTSRAKTCDDSLVGFIAKSFTILQCKLNGLNIKNNDIYFYPNDESKINGIISRNPDVVFDDKKEIIEELRKQGLKVLFIDEKYNQDVLENKDTIRFKEFSEANDKIEEVIGKTKIKFYERAAKSDIFFNKAKLVSPLVMQKFKPIIINSKNLISVENEPVIYAPNHRSTLDPVVITSIILKNIHWAALLRFFKADDSIFNNNKNRLLCKLTSKTFKRLEYFPIDRKSDNKDANNIRAIRDMNGFLKVNQSIGIFAEGTTRREKGHDFGTFDDSFIILGKKNDAWIQPITTLWLKELNIPSKVIINFGKPFKVVGTKEEAMEHFLKVQRECLDENMEVRDNLEKIKVKTF